MFKLKLSTSINMHLVLSHSTFTKERLDIEARGHWNVSILFVFHLLTLLFRHNHRRHYLKIHEERCVEIVYIPSNGMHVGMTQSEMGTSHIPLYSDENSFRWRFDENQTNSQTFVNQINKRLCVGSFNSTSFPMQTYHVQVIRNCQEKFNYEYPLMWYQCMWIWLASVESSAVIAKERECVREEEGWSRRTH